EQAVSSELHRLHPVAYREEGARNVRHWKAETDVGAGTELASEVTNRELRASTIRRGGATDHGSANGRIGVRHAYIVDVATVLPVARDSLALPEQVRLVQPDETSNAVPLSERGTEVHVPRPLLLHGEDDVHITLFVGR